MKDLRGGFAALAAHFGERVRLEAVQHVVITHSHIDHFGFVGWFQDHTRAAIYIHELDARVLQNFEERIVLASKDVRVFLERAGLGRESREELEAMYRESKSFFKSVRLDRKLRDGDRIVNGYAVHHVPGHCPGQICVQVDEVLFTADHVLARITPHQSPAAITPFCGLEHYLQSLGKVRRLPGITLALQNPANATAWNNLGLALTACNRLTDAIEALRRAIALRADFGEAHWNLALALLANGDFDEGWREPGCRGGRAEPRDPVPESPRSGLDHRRGPLLRQRSRRSEGNTWAVCGKSGARRAGMR